MIRQPTATWNAKQERLAILLASGRSVKDAAVEAGIGERTAHTWLDDPAYRAFIAELRGRMLNEAVGKLTDATGAAADELRRLLKDEAASIRLRAATAILDALVKVREHTE